MESAFFAAGKNANGYDSNTALVDNAAPVFLFDMMNDPFLLLGFSTSLLELLSFVLSLVCVALNIRQLHWAWLFSIISSGLYAGVFFNARLYGDMGLQIVFILVSVWGWVNWLQGRDNGAGLRVSRLATSGWFNSLVGWLLSFAVLAWFLKTYTDTDVPYSDAFLTAGSLLGQVLLSRKKLENWHVWVLVDILYVALYVYKGLMLTAVLYGIFVLMALAGLRTWSKTCPQ